MDEENKRNGAPEDSLPVRDEAYYENLYNDLPPEVVDILMKTHPLRSANRAETPSMRRPRAERNVSRKRSRQPEHAMGSPRHTEPVEEPVKADEPVMAAEPAPVVVEEPRETPVESAPVWESPAPVAEEAPIPEPVAAEPPAAAPEPERPETVEDSGRNELAQMVRQNAGRPKPETDPKSFTQSVAQTITKNVTQNLEKVQQSVKEARQSAGRELSEADVAAMEQLSREEAMQNFFEGNDEGDYDDYDDRRGSSPALIAAVVVLVIVAGFFGFRSFSLSSQLKKTEANVTELEDLKTANEQLKMEKLELENQLAALQTPDTATGETGETGGETAPETAPEPATPQAQTYTVQAGDTLGSIARAMYGDFSKYTVIAQANGLSENATLNIGQTLTIPAQ